MDDERILGTLRQVAATHEYVRITRSNEGADTLYGFVVRARPAWTLVAKCSEMMLDGFEAVRTDDIVKVRRQGTNSPAVRWLTLQGIWPPAAPRTRIRLGTARGVIDSAAVHYGMVGVHHEENDTLNIGVPVGFRKKSFELWEIDADGEWWGTPSRYRFERISRITFGDRYTQVLRELAPPAPPGLVAPHRP
ncbi:hypothetical protein [Streptomyces sp. SP18CS02]|uniref:hypothetical protein n=1 Tax=Streptomyces sp. SP18CS02 TaxID=3002531 RepID=UPI002E779003|nr:hypothetical protein [Streptomyces sp. SP18CS02]MEE1751520.1 hypothetical protein [Streptomyces sp. SP18CS02]